MKPAIWKPIAVLPLQGGLAAALQALLSHAGTRYQPTNGAKCKVTFCIDTQNDQGQITFGPEELKLK